MSVICHRQPTYRAVLVQRQYRQGLQHVSDHLGVFCTARTIASMTDAGAAPAGGSCRPRSSSDRAGGPGARAATAAAALQGPPSAEAVH